MPTKTNIEAFNDAIGRGCCLVIGESITTDHPPFNSNEEEYIFEKDVLLIEKSSYILDSLASVNWSCIISLTRDVNFEKALRRHYDESSETWNFALINEATTTVPEKCSPLYKLLGSVDKYNVRDDPVSDLTSHLLRRPQWRSILKDIEIYLKGRPIFFIGIKKQANLVFELLGELKTLLKGGGAGSTFIFLETEVELALKKIEGLTKEIDLLLLEGNVESIVNKIIPIRKQPNRSTIEGDLKIELSNNDFFVVPKAIEIEDYNKIKHERMLNELFSPMFISWGAFKANLDWKRTESTQIHDYVMDWFSHTNDSCESVKLFGDSGTGKTIILKRAAYDLTQSGCLCFWLNPSGIDGRNAIMEIVKLLDGKKFKNLKTVFFIDNASHHIGLIREIFSLTKSKNKWMVVCSFRRSDFLNNIPELNSNTQSEFSLAPTLNEKEYDDFNVYVNRMEFNSDLAKAYGVLEKRETRDILCALWYLIPKSQSSIKESIISEYLSLNNRNYIEEYIEWDSQKPLEAKKAYEYICVASSLRIPLPTDLIVSAIGTSYTQWAKLSRDEKSSIWGLVYEFENSENQVYYTSRNSVVTEIIVREINGNIGNAAELKLLKELIATCDSSTPPYRQFLIDLLINAKNDLSERYPYLEVKKLWELALTTFRAEDRTLAHQFGLFLKDEGKEYSDAYRALLKAIQVKSYAMSEREERIGAIENSLASVVVQKVSNGEMNAEDGNKLVKQHISNARKAGEYGSYSSHIQANQLYEMSKALKETDEEKSVESLNSAFQILSESSLLEEQSEATKEVFESLRGKMVSSIQLPENLHKFGRDFYAQHKNLDGFILAGRSLLENAIKSQKRKSFKKADDYIAESISWVQNNKIEVANQLYFMRIECLFRWKILLRADNIPWGLIKEYSSLLIQDSKFDENIFLAYIYSISLFHLNDPIGAQQMIRTISKNSKIPRGLKHSYKALALDKNGNVKTFQGQLKKSGQNIYIESVDAGLSLIGHTGDFKGISEQTVIFSIRFAPGMIQAIKAGGY